MHSPSQAATSPPAKVSGPMLPPALHWSALAAESCLTTMPYGLPVSWVNNVFSCQLHTKRVYFTKTRCSVAATGFIVPSETIRNLFNSAGAPERWEALHKYLPPHSQAQILSVRSGPFTLSTGSQSELPLQSRLVWSRSHRGIPYRPHRRILSGRCGADASQHKKYQGRACGCPSQRRA